MAVTVKVASFPASVVTLFGWPVMAGAPCTVSVEGWLTTTVP